VRHCWLLLQLRRYWHSAWVPYCTTLKWVVVVYYTTQYWYISLSIMYLIVLRWDTSHSIIYLTVSRRDISLSIIYFIVLSLLGIKFVFSSSHTLGLLMFYFSQKTIMSLSSSCSTSTSWGNVLLYHMAFSNWLFMNTSSVLAAVSYQVFRTLWDFNLDSRHMNKNSIVNGINYNVPCE